MKLTRLLCRHFYSGDRQRGRRYFLSNAICEFSADLPYVYALVSGGSGVDYEVAINLDEVGPENDGGMHCECERYAGGDNCKHIWAVLLEIEDDQGEEALAWIADAFEDEQAFDPGSDQVVDQGANGSRSGNTATEKRKRKKATRQPAAPTWQHVLKSIDSSKHGTRPNRSVREHKPIVATKTVQVFYGIDASQPSDSYRVADELNLQLYQQDLLKSGEWGAFKQLRLNTDSLESFTNADDRAILRRLIGHGTPETARFGYSFSEPTWHEFVLSRDWDDDLLQMMASTGRLVWSIGLSNRSEDLHPLSYDSNVHKIHLKILDENPLAASGQTATPGEYWLYACLRSSADDQESETEFSPGEVLRATDGGLVLTSGVLLKYDNPQCKDLLRSLTESGPVRIKQSERGTFLETLMNVPDLPPFTLPDAWQIDMVDGTPRPQLTLEKHPYASRQLITTINFGYADQWLASSDLRSVVYDHDNGVLIRRNDASEQERLEQLTPFPIQEQFYGYGEPARLTIHPKHFDWLVSELSEQNWQVLWKGKPIRQPGDFSIAVTTNNDWFDLHASVDYSGETIALPKLLAAIAKKENFITLADGSSGRIPGDLVNRFASLAQFGTVDDEVIKFRPTQAMMLDAMLQSQSRTTFDSGFRKYRKKLAAFDGVKTKTAPRGFRGELREYQEQGLGWLNFLRDFGLGGCLADDMGLGKTIQVLALLESRRLRKVAATETNKKTKQSSTMNGDAAELLSQLTGTKSKSKSKSKSDKAKAARDAELANRIHAFKRPPSIVVVPKSLIFNWIEEAKKFTPRLRIHNHTGIGRNAAIDDMNEFDVLLTTYGTMRKDIVSLSKIRFDYAILDESQAIKNASAQAAKASRLLHAEHRLAMTGTPIENHLGELWSLMEFLNPGMLGKSKSFARLTRAATKPTATDEGPESAEAGETDDPRDQAIAALAKGLRPFLLRRTKDQVLKELPPKTEQTLHCDLTPSQKKQYKELKEFYRVKLAKQVETEGIEKSKIYVLEALLRLRQVACDPRLVDPASKPGAKLELLQEQLTEVIAGGHKVLVFSQFTKLLALVKQQLDDAGIRYEYLDGKTTDRAGKVNTFQNDDAIPVFLISLKAGGSGLNLTAAQYVYLLDPWWNPAVEAQAIDRAHRMGQQNSVMAYRMICNDTVEEKILKLQASKRDLAASVISADESLIRSLTADDLQQLFS